MARVDKRLQIMKAAEKLFASRRFHEIVMSDVARAAKVGKGTIYQYFENKEALFFQVATSGFDELCKLLGRRVPQEAPFAEQLADAIGQITEFFEGRRQLFRMMHSEEFRLAWAGGNLREQWLTQRQKLIAAVTEIVQKGVDERAVRSDLSPELLTTVLLGMLRTRACELAVGKADWPEHSVLIDLFLNGAGRPDDADGPADSPPAESAAGA